MSSYGASLLSALLLVTTSARADPRETALVVGGATAVASAGAAVTLLGDRDPERARIGWLTLQGGAALAPLAAHLARGELWRGLVFAALPALGTAFTATIVDGSVDDLTSRDQRALWALTTASVIAAAVGVVDAVTTREEARR